MLKFTRKFSNLFSSITTNTRNKQILLLAVVMVLLYSCEDTGIDRPIPENSSPIISRIFPSPNTLQVRSGDSIRLDFIVADQEALQDVSLRVEVFDENDQFTGEVFTVLESNLFPLTSSRINYRDTIKTFPPFTTLQYICTVRDNKEAKDSSSFFVSILSSDSSNSRFRTEYVSDKLLYHRQSGKDYSLNFTTQKMYPSSGSNILEQDIAEASSINDDANLLAQLISPAALELGQDSIFTITDSTRFNFQEATYQTILEAKISDPSPSDQVILKAGNYIIVSLTKAPQPQFAVMRIKEVVDQAGYQNDYIRFDYVVTKSL